MQVRTQKSFLPSILVSAAVFLLVTAVSHFSYPQPNWDNLAYVGIAEMFRGANVIEAHRSTYAQAKEALSEKEYEKLVTNVPPDDPYRSIVAKDPESFRQQLPFYSVKPLYPLLIAVFREGGVNGVVASLMISAMSIGLVAGFCCYWLSRHYTLAPAAVLAVLIAFSAYVFHTGSDPRPDALYSAVVTAMVMMAVMAKRLSWSLVLVMLLAILARPDAIVLCTFVCLAWMIARPEDRRRAIATLALCIVCYVALTQISRNYGWLTLIYFAFVKYNPYPQTMPATIHLSDIVHLYLTRLHPMREGAFILMLLIALGGVLLTLVVYPLRSPMVLFTAAVAAAMIAHFVLFPGVNTRVRTAYHIVSMVMMLVSISSVQARLDSRIKRWLFVPPDTQPAV